MDTDRIEQQPIPGRPRRTTQGPVGLRCHRLPGQRRLGAGLGALAELLVGDGEVVVAVGGTGGARDPGAFGADEGFWLQADERLAHAPYVAAHRKDPHVRLLGVRGSIFWRRRCARGWLGVRRAAGIPVARARDSAPRGPPYVGAASPYFSGGGEAQSVGLRRAWALTEQAGFPFFCRAAAAASGRGEADAGGIGGGGGPFLADGQ